MRRWRCGDAAMRRCGDAAMRRCGEQAMWRAAEGRRPHRRSDTPTPRPAGALRAAECAIHPSASIGWALAHHEPTPGPGPRCREIRSPVPVLGRETPRRAPTPGGPGPTLCGRQGAGRAVLLRPTRERGGTSWRWRASEVASNRRPPPASPLRHAGAAIGGPDPGSGMRNPPKRRHRVGPGPP